MAVGLCVCLSTIVMSCSPVFADDSEEVEIGNKAKTGNVDLHIEEYVGESEKLMPTQVVVYTTDAVNDGNEAWFRAKVEIVSGSDRLEVSDEMVAVNPEWTKIGDYYYLKEPVATGDSKRVTETVTIPNLENISMHTGFDVIVTVDAIQRANFEPDFSSSDPWHGTKVEKSVHTGAGSTKTRDKKFSVVYEGKALGLVASSENFFENWPSLMPGDTKTGTLVLKNSGKKTVEIFFENELKDKNPILDKVNLKITMGDKVIYNGPISGLIKKTSLGKLKIGESEELKYEVSLPAELGNEYTLQDIEATWIFSVEEIDKAKGGDDVKTGDTTPVGAWVAGIAVSALALGYLVKKRRALQ